MKNTTATATVSVNIVEIVGRIRLLSGVVAMAIGLILFVLWFGWSLNSYIDNIAPRPEGSRSAIVTAASVGAATRADCLYL